MAQRRSQSNACGGGVCAGGLGRALSAQASKGQGRCAREAASRPSGGRCVSASLPLCACRAGWKRRRKSDAVAPAERRGFNGAGAEKGAEELRGWGDLGEFDESVKAALIARLNQSIADTKRVPFPEGRNSLRQVAPSVYPYLLCGFVCALLAIAALVFFPWLLLAALSLGGAFESSAEALDEDRVASGSARRDWLRALSLVHVVCAVGLCAKARHWFRRVVEGNGNTPRGDGRRVECSPAGTERASPLGRQHSAARFKPPGGIWRILAVINLHSGSNDALEEFEKVLEPVSLHVCAALLFAALRAMRAMRESESERGFALRVLQELRRLMPCRILPFVLSWREWGFFAHFLCFFEDAFDLVLCLGGDGTYNTVLGLLLRIRALKREAGLPLPASPPRITPVPVGTSNTWVSEFVYSEGGAAAAVAYAREAALHVRDLLLQALDQRRCRRNSEGTEAGGEGEAGNEGGGAAGEGICLTADASGTEGGFSAEENAALAEAAAEAAALSDAEWGCFANDPTTNGNASPAGPASSCALERLLRLLQEDSRSAAKRAPSPPAALDGNEASESASRRLHSSVPRKNAARLPQHQRFAAAAQTLRRRYGAQSGEERGASLDEQEEQAGGGRGWVEGLEGGWLEEGLFSQDEARGAPQPAFVAERASRAYCIECCLDEKSVCARHQKATDAAAMATRSASDNAMAARQPAAKEFLQSAIEACLSLQKFTAVAGKGRDGPMKREGTKALLHFWCRVSGKPRAFREKSSSPHFSFLRRR